MIASWNPHVAQLRSPAILPDLMRQAGFVVEAVTPVPFCDTMLKPDGLARMMMVLMESYAVENRHVSAEDARAWAEEQEKLARQGRFFFNLDHFVVSARRS